MMQKSWFDEDATDAEDAPGMLSAMAMSLQSTVARIEDSPEESYRRKELLTNMEAYLGRRLSSLYQIHGESDGFFSSSDRALFNVTYSVINTIRSRICSFRARAQFIPSNGDAQARRVARDLTTMSDAWADEVQYQKEASFAFRDLLTSDTGCIKIYRDGDKIKASRFPPWEFLVDPAEAVYGEPECLYHVTYVPLDVAAAKFDVDPVLLNGAVVSAPRGITYSSDRQVVRVVEGWRRGPDGRHVVVVGSHVHEDEVWKYDKFPVAFRSFDEAPVGMWGVSAITPILGLQRELNLTQERLQEAHANAVGLAWILGAGESVTSKITNAHTTILREKNPGAIRTINPPPLHPEAYQYLEVIKGMVYDTLGVSQFIAAGTKQPGVNSAVAIRESSELQSDRLSLLSQLWETWRVEVATWWRDLTRDMAADGVKPKWRGLNRGAWQEFVFPAESDDYEIRAFPSSVFGQTVSGRLEKAMEASEKGWISAEDAMKAIDVPDLAPMLDLRMAETYALENIVDDILERNEYVTPDEMINPEKLGAYARSRYLLALTDGAKYSTEVMSKMLTLNDYAAGKV